MADIAHHYIDRQRLLADLAEAAAELADILRRESDGTRDGDGTWQGAGAFGAALHDVEPRVHELAELFRAADSAQRFADQPF